MQFQAALHQAKSWLKVAEGNKTKFVEASARASQLDKSLEEEQESHKGTQALLVATQKEKNDLINEYLD